MVSDDWRGDEEEAWRLVSAFRQDVEEGNSIPSSDYHLDLIRRARASAFEEAAGVCEKEAREWHDEAKRQHRPSGMHDMSTERSYQAQACADRIRALADKDTGETP